MLRLCVSARILIELRVYVGVGVEGGIAALLRGRCGRVVWAARGGSLPAAVQRQLVPAGREKTADVHA